MMAKMFSAKKISLFLLFLTGCGFSMFSNAIFGKSSKFDWLATESAPVNYPMQIISGNLRYHGDSNGRGLYVPAGPIFQPGWGKGRSTHITGDEFKALPDQLSITYFSYMENTFYTGKFDLPYEKILKLFKAGGRNEDDPNWCHYITVGVAPGGAVSVWVGGLIKNIEVFHGQAEKTDMDFVKVMDLTVSDRDGFVKKVLQSSVEAATLDSMQKNGIPFGVWGKYRTQYNWTPVFIQSSPEQTGIRYFNGEKERPYLPFDKNFLVLTRPVPLGFYFQSQINGQGKKYLFDIEFDSTEVQEVFAKLGGQQEPLQLEIEPKFPKALTQVRLRNAKEVITFKKCVIQP